MKLKISVALLAFVTAVIPLSLSAESDLARAVASRDAARTYANLPLRFEPAAEQGHFLARSGGYAVLVGAGESAIAITDATSGSTRTLRFSFDRSNAAAQIEAIEPLPGITNYYIGQDPGKWRLGVRNFAKLRTKDVYPGVDVIYYGDNRRLEFDFVVAPMADPRAIALTLSGMDKLYINADGELVAEVNGRAVRFAKPYAYQKVSGSAKAVSVEYALAGPGRAQLQIGDYDKNLELVIDPILSYSTYLGGSQGDTANGIAVDAAGTAYITGQTCSIGKDANPIVFPAPTPNPSGTTVEGVSSACNAYVTKLDPTGATVLFTTFISGTAPAPSNASASGNGIALDNLSLNPNPVPIHVPARPNVYVVGTTGFSDMPIVGYTASVPASVSPTWPGGDSDPFIAILDSSTGTLIRTTYLGGNGIDAGYAITVDPQQNVIVAGKTSSFNFPAYNGFEPITEAYVAFVTKLDFGLHIAPPILNGASPMSPRAASLTDHCGSTCPATPDPTATYYFFSAVYGGQLVAPPPTWSYQSGVTIAYGTITEVTPTCPTTTPPTTYATMRIVALNGGTTGGINWVANNLCANGVLGEVIPDNGGFNWLVLALAPWIGPISASTEAYGVVLDPQGDVFAVGGSSTTQLHPSLPGPAYSPGGFDWLPQADTYWDGTGSWIIKLHGHDTSTGSKNAGWPVYVTALETNMTDKTGKVDAARAVTVDSQGAAYVVGTTTGTMLSATGLNESSLGASPTTDAYILKMQSPAEVEYATYLGGTGNDQGLAVAVDAGGWAYIAGSTQSANIPVINAIIDGSGNSLNQLKGTQQEAYLAKVTPDGTALIMSAYLGGSGGDQANAMALSPTGNGDIYLAGNTNSYDFPLVPVAVPGNTVLGRSANAGNGDAFVTKVLGASFPMVTISPISQSLTFANQAVGFSSVATQTVTLTSTGQVPLTINSITSTGDFTQVNTCGTGLPAATSSQNTCTITVTFTPSAVGTRSGTLTISDDATNSPQTVGLQGNGVLVQDSVSPLSLSFASTTLGTTSAAQTVTVTNTDTAQTLIISSVPVITGDYSLSSNTCNSLLAPGQSCTVGVTFTPVAPGSRIGTLIINGNGNTFPATVSLTGVGNGSGSVSGSGGTPSALTLTASPTALTVAKGAQETVTITLTAPTGFSQTVTLACTATGGATCTVTQPSPNPVTGAAPSTATVTVSVPSGNTITISNLIRPGRLLATLLPFGGIGLIFAGRRRRWLLMLGLVVCLALGMVNCGGGGGGGGGSSSSSQTPQLKVTATTPSGSSQVVVALTMQ